MSRASLSIGALPAGDQKPLQNRHELSQLLLVLIVCFRYRSSPDFLCSITPPRIFIAMVQVLVLVIGTTTVYRAVMLHITLYYW